MLFYLAVALLLGSLPTITAQQNVTLIDPQTRYRDMNLTLPPQSHPVLQRNFETPPDCGEESYRGTGRLQGLRTLITGGDSGIGRAVVIAYLREGASVAINYLPEEEPDAQDLADFVAQENFSIERIPGDLTNETFCALLVEEAASRLGGLDILIGNAAWAPSQFGPGVQPITNHSTAQLERVFRTNLYANFWLSRAAVPLLPPGGSIIFTTSGMADNPQAAVLDYGASKAALNHLTTGLARQLIPRGIRVNAVQPALTYTPLLSTMGFTGEIGTEIASVVPYGRLEQPAELAPLFVSLADPSGTFTSGNAYSAAGGATFR